MVKYNNSLDFLQYLKNKGVKIVKESRNQILAECFFGNCHARSKSKNPRLYIKKDTGQYFCQNCHEKGNAITIQKYFGDDILISSSQTQNIVIEQETRNLKAESIWNKLSPAASHSYLIKKQINPSIARLNNSCLVVPIYNSGNEIQSLQFISPDGTKRFLSGAKTSGGYAIIGEVENRICIAEGFATASSIYEATGYATIIAFSSNNLEKVVPIIREKYPSTEIILCGDSDLHGKELAEKVAKTFEIRLAIPLFKTSENINGKDPTDFNDLFVLYGKNEVQKQIENSKKQKFENSLGLITLADLLNEPEEEIQWIVDGILPVGGLSLCVAKPKGGKSTLIRQLIISVARGNSFLGRKTEKGTVVHVVLEGLKVELTDHYKRLIGQDCNNVKVYFGGRPEKAMNWLEKICIEYKPQFIVIDTFFKLLEISDLNDYVKTNNAIEPIFNLSKKYNVHILGIHHARKGGGEDGEATLGSTAIFGAVDTLIYLNKKDGKTTVETIQRYGEKLEPTVLNFDKDTKTFDIGVTVIEDKLEMISYDILEYLNIQSGWLLESEILEVISAKTGVKRSSLRLLVEENKIQRIGSGRRGDPYRYANLNVVNELVSEVQSGEELTS
jgi:5S rRNA maturation endonuclease (ribonuclease M5)